MIDQEMTVEQAKTTIAQAFQNDSDFRQGYVDNVACLIMDNIPGYKRNKDKRDAIADKVIKLVFET